MLNISSSLLNWKMIFNWQIMKYTKIKITCTCTHTHIAFKYWYVCMQLCVDVSPAPNTACSKFAESIYFQMIYKPTLTITK